MTFWLPETEARWRKWKAMIVESAIGLIVLLFAKTVTPHGSLRLRLSRSLHASNMGQCCHALPTLV